MTGFAWPEVALGEVVTKLQDGPFGSNLKSSDYVHDGVRVIRLRNIGVGKFDDTDEAFVSSEHFARLNKHCCLPGDVLVATLGDPIIRACRQPAWIPKALNKADCLQLRCDANKALPEYIVRVLNSPHIQKSAEMLSHGQTRPRVNLTQLRALRVPLPPIEEQRRIAAVLDQADELRAKRRASIALIDSLNEALFLDLIGPRWPLVTIGDLAEARPHAVRTGPFGSQLLHSEFVDEGIAVLGIDNAVQDRFVWARPRFVTQPKYERLRRYRVHPGDVLITIMGTCGRSAVVPDDVPLAINSKHLCCITLDREICLPEFLWSCMRFHRGLRRQLGATTRGAVMPGLNMGLIKRAQVPLPPIKAQREFATRLASTQTLNGFGVSSEAAFDALFASLQHRAFAGQL